MQLDVFLCTYAKDDIRKGLRDAVIARWKQMPVNLAVIDGVAMGIRGKEFQGIRRAIAESKAKSDIYILAEDDCMPLGKRFLDAGLSLMAAYPRYGVLAPTVLNGVYEGAAYKYDGDVIEANSAGGINFTRKGIIDLPTGFQDEMGQANALRLKGWKSGYMKNVKVNHLGAFLSTLWPVSYTGETQVSG
jgi:hypothetical protein